MAKFQQNLNHLSVSGGGDSWISGTAQWPKLVIIILHNL